MSRVQPLIGESEVPTEHVLRVGRQDHFVSCAIDLLLNAVNGPVVGRTRCPICRSDIRVKVDGLKITVLRPPGTVAFVHEVATPECEREVVCSDSNLFDSDLCLTAWRSSHGSVTGARYRIEEYLRRCADRRASLDPVEPV
jgi:hypothetical protein